MLERWRCLEGGAGGRRARWLGAQEGDAAPGVGLHAVVQAAALQLHVAAGQGKGVHAGGEDVAGRDALPGCEIPAETPGVDGGLHASAAGSLSTTCTAAAKPSLGAEAMQRQHDACMIIPSILHGQWLVHELRSMQAGGAVCSTDWHLAALLALLEARHWDANCYKHACACVIPHAGSISQQ